MVFSDSDGIFYDFSGRKYPGADSPVFLSVSPTRLSDSMSYDRFYHLISGVSVAF